MVKNYGTGIDGLDDAQSKGMEKISMEASSRPDKKLSNIMLICLQSEGNRASRIYDMPILTHQLLSHSKGKTDGEVEAVKKYTTGYRIEVLLHLLFPVSSYSTSPPSSFSPFSFSTRSPKKKPNSSSMKANKPHLTIGQPPLD